MRICGLRSDVLLLFNGVECSDIWQSARKLNSEAVDGWQLHVFIHGGILKHSDVIMTIYLCEWGIGQSLMQL